jgi:hypothetical protein
MVILLLVVRAELTKQTLAERLLIHDVVVRFSRQAVLKMYALRYMRKVHQLFPFLAAAFTVIGTPLSGLKINSVCHNVL